MYSLLYTLLSHVWVIIDRVWNGVWICWPPYTHNLELHSAVNDLRTLQFTVRHTRTHAHTHTMFSVFACRILASNLTQWRSFMFHGHAVARWSTFHTWTHSAIFWASLAKPISWPTVHFELSNSTILNWTLLCKHFAQTEQKTRFPTIPLLLCLLTHCLETGSSIVACTLLREPAYRDIA
jgi:hypothetical protein